MQLGSLFSIANSGLAVESRRLAQSATNVANVNTDGYEGQRVVNVSRGGGGVAAASAPTYSPQGMRVEGDGSLARMSNTDIADEMITQLSSLRAFQANVAVLRTADEALGSLLDTKA
jgi:flagellar basal-body rod protein FlgC